LARLDPARLIEVISREYDDLELTPTPTHPRRPGVTRARYEKVIKELTLSFASLRDHGGADVETYTGKALHIASFLFVTGADQAQWRKWMALAGFGYALMHDEGRARAGAILAGEWDFLTTLKAAVPDDAELADRVLAKLTGSESVLMPLEAAADDYDRACLLLATSIPAADHRTTEEALETICEFWAEMASYLHEPNPELYPEFEPKIAALAALAYRSGYRPRALSPDARLLLEPGFAGSDTHDWFARYFS
jgi:hypothetical protein